MCTVYGNPEYHAMIREMVMDYIQSERNFFSNFISEDFEGYIDRMKVGGQAYGQNREENSALLYDYMYMLAM